MAEPVALLAEFATPQSLVEAVKAARAQGWRVEDAFTPFPVEELPEALGITERRMGWIGLGGGIAGFASAYAMQIATNLDYPIRIGGRPLLALQSFALIAFELSVLFAVLAMMAGLFILCRLPHYHHPLFDIARFEHATRDGFFLLVAGQGREALATLDPLAIFEVKP